MLKQHKSAIWTKWSARGCRVRTRFTNRDETGASLVEYALLLALIAVVAITALTFLGHTVSNTLNNVGNDIAAGAAGGGGGGGGNTAPTFTSNNSLTFNHNNDPLNFQITTGGTLPLTSITVTGAGTCGPPEVDSWSGPTCFGNNNSATGWGAALGNINLAAGTASITGNPRSGDTGTYVFTITATNSVGSTPQTFTLTIT